MFAVIALAVSQRKREIGIRIALGAKPMSVAGMFFLSGLRMGAAGVLIGLPISVLLVHVGLSQGLIIAPVSNLPVVGIGIAMVVLAVAAASFTK